MNLKNRITYLALALGVLVFLFLVLVPQKVDVRDVATAVNSYINEQEKSAIANYLAQNLPVSI
jgi:hypothetical protein